MKTKWYVNVLRYLIVAIIMIIMIFPLFYVLNTSFKSNSEFLKDPLGLASSINFENYIAAWEKANLGEYALNSVYYAGVTTIISILMAMFLAFPLARKYFKYGGLIYLAFMIGMFLPDGTVPRWQIIMKMGLYNTRTGYMLTLLNGGGVTLMMFISYIKSIPKDLDEAATLDGCGYFTYVFKILTPLMKPAIASMAVLSCINTWNEILGSIIYLSREELYPITRGLYVFKGDYSVQWPMLTAALVIVAIPMVLVYIFLQKYIIDGIVSGGVKA